MNTGLLVNLKELRRNFAKADFKYGKSSYCFINGDYIVKVYARKKYGYYPENVCDFSKNEAKTIVFPRMYIRENGSIVAEVSKYINNDDIIKSFNADAKLNVIVKGFDLVVEDFYTYQDIRMDDLCSANILFSNELGYHLIDTTQWKKIEGSLKFNLALFNMALISVINDYLEIPVVYSVSYNKIDQDFYQNMAKFGNPGLRLQACMTLIMNNRFDFLRLLYALMDGYRVYSKQDAKTLGDVKEFVKVLGKG